MYRANLAVCWLLVAAVVVGPAGATDRTNEGNDEQTWQEHDGRLLPRHLADALANFDNGMGAADALALYRAQNDDITVYGDIWSVCLSDTDGCGVADASGTFDDDCDHYPIANQVWVYVTMPAVLEVTATGDAVGVWEDFIFKTTGTFTSGTITGTSCVIFDDPERTVVRSNGKAEYTF